MLPLFIVIMYWSTLNSHAIDKHTRVVFWIFFPPYTLVSCNDLTKNLDRTELKAGLSNLSSRKIQ